MKVTIHPELKIKHTVLLYQYDTEPVIHTSPELDVRLEMTICVMIALLMPSIIGLTLYLTH